MPLALAELVGADWAPIAAYASRLLDGNLDAGKDMAQEVFLRIWQRRIRRQPTSGSVRTFLYALARNLSLNQRRSVRGRIQALQRIEALFRDWLRTPTPLELVQQAAERPAIERVIARLPPRRREIFVLVRAHGLSYREVAEILEISPQTVANQMSAALAQLRRLL